MIALRTKSVGVAGIALGGTTIMAATAKVVSLLSDPHELIALAHAVKTHTDPTGSVAALIAATIGLAGACLIALLMAWFGAPPGKSSGSSIAVTMVPVPLVGQSPTALGGSSMSIISQLLGDLGPIEGKLADIALADLKANEPAVLAKAAQLNINAADEVVAVVENALPKGGIFLLIAPSIRAALNNAKPEIVTALGGEEQALVHLAEAAIGSFAAAHGG